MTDTCLFIVILAVAFFAFPLFAAEFHVSPRGNEDGIGTAEHPFQTVTRASQAAHPGDTVYIHAGTYSECFRPANSGTRDAPIIFRAVPGENPPVISAYDSLTEWAEDNNGIWSCRFSSPLPDSDNSIANRGTPLIESRWPVLPEGADRLTPSCAEMGYGSNKSVIVCRDLPPGDHTGARVWIQPPLAWSAWATTVKACEANRLDIDDRSPPWRKHQAAKGGRFVLIGSPALPLAPGTWVYDAKKNSLRIRPGDGLPPGDRYEVRTRLVTMDASGMSSIRLQGITFLGGSVVTDFESSNLTFSKCRFLHGHHTWATQNASPADERRAAVDLRGTGHTFEHCEIDWSAGSGLHMVTRDSRIINNYIHNINYLGVYAAPLEIGKRNRDGKNYIFSNGNVISHNTLARCGRSTLHYPGMHNDLFQRNHMKGAGLLTEDLGLTYANIVKGGNSEVRFNLCHSNHAHNLSTGLYYDHGTRDFHTHHNLVFNNDCAMRINHYAYFHQVDHNIFVGPFKSTWGNKYANDLYGCSLGDNLFFGGNIETTADNLSQANNLFSTNTQGNAPDWASRLGGLEKIMSFQKSFSPPLPFEAGHNFDSPSTIDATRTFPRHRNHLRSPAFECWELEPWRLHGNAEWNHHPHVSQTDENYRGRMGNHCIRLHDDNDGLTQRVAELNTTTYEFSVWLRCHNGADVELGVFSADNKPVETKRVRIDRIWKRYTVPVIPQGGNAQVGIFRRSASKKPVYVDETGLFEPFAESSHKD